MGDRLAYRRWALNRQTLVGKWERNMPSKVNRARKETFKELHSTGETFCHLFESSQVIYALNLLLLMKLHGMLNFSDI